MYNHIIIIFKIKNNIIINLIKDSISAHHYALKNNQLLSFEEEEEEEELIPKKRIKLYNRHNN